MKEMAWDVGKPPYRFVSGFWSIAMCACILVKINNTKILNATR